MSKLKKHNIQSCVHLFQMIYLWCHDAHFILLTVLDTADM